MSIAAWIAEFRQLHEKARKDELTGESRKLYFEAREHFAKALLGAQGLTQPPGQTARQTFRVAQAFQVDLKVNSESVRALTVDVSRGGFSAVMAQSPDLNEVLSFSLRLPGGDFISGKAKVTGNKKQGPNVRVSFAFDKVTEAEIDRLESVMFDCVLSRVPA